MKIPTLISTANRASPPTIKPHLCPHQLPLHTPLHSQTKWVVYHPVTKNDQNTTDTPSLTNASVMANAIGMANSAVMANAIATLRSMNAIATTTTTAVAVVPG